MQCAWRVGIGGCVERVERVRDAAEWQREAALRVRGLCPLLTVGNLEEGSEYRVDPCPSVLRECVFGLSVRTQARVKRVRERERHSRGDALCAHTPVRTPTAGRGSIASR